MEQIKDLYNYWSLNYCNGKTLEYVGLQNEPYFKYFAYPDFLTPFSGLNQIRKYTVLKTETELLLKFEKIAKLSKAVKKEIYRLLVDEFKYFVTNQYL